MQLNEVQKKLFDLLVEKKLPQTDLFSVMLVLTKEEKARKMIDYLLREESPTPDQICEQAGKIAFEEEKNS